VGIIRRLWPGERLTHDGKHYQPAVIDFFAREVLPKL